MAEIADMFAEGLTAEQVVEEIKEQATIEASETKSAASIGQAMVEQDISTSPSLITDLRTDYLMGNITDEQYKAVYNALGN